MDMKDINIFSIDHLESECKQQYEKLDRYYDGFKKIKPDKNDSDKRNLIYNINKTMAMILTIENFIYAFKESGEVKSKVEEIKSTEEIKNETEDFHCSENE